MKLYLIRHGATKEGAEGIILGSIGGNLNEKGLKYSENVAGFFINHKIAVAKLLCSDLSRAIQTAEIISKQLNLPLTKYSLIRERSAGIAEGKKEIDIDWERYESVSLPDRKHLGGESFQEVKNRAEQFLNMLKEGQQEDILIISHSVFILMLLSLIKNTSIETELKTKTGNQIFIIDLDRKTIETIDITHSQ